MNFDIVVVGGINSDFVVKGERLPGPGETVVCDGYFQGPGGKGANQAVAAARLGARVALVGCVGDDERGSAMIRSLKREGVETRFVFRAKNVPTGVALILVDLKGEKTIGAVMGANGHLTAGHVRRAAAAFKNCKVLLMQFEALDPALLEAARAAKKTGAKIVLDPAPPRKVPDGLFPLLDVVRPNSAEAKFLTKIEVGDVSSARKAAAKLMAKGVAAVALQAGSGADLFVWPGGEVVLPHFKVKAVDATGAGDAFASGLSVALAKGLPFAEAGRWASATAALKTTKMGAQAGLPTRRKLLKFLRQNAG